MALFRSNCDWGSEGCVDVRDACDGGLKEKLWGQMLGDGSNETSRAFFDCSVTVVETTFNSIVVFESLDGLLCSILEALKFTQRPPFLL